ncbi:unnamed protein product [Trichogramma brassicae]|uniref:HTH CENPB-type domain-containing protein n=1 Tax=Trichogramma brassicae TaxID=86971 RepID=A0A6H5I8X2_9HYME|nr:unnamed protein product [Trichogramma brassicae]
MESSNAKKRKILSVNDKFLIIQDLQNHKSHTQVCNAYQLSSSTVSTIWKNRDSIIKSFEECGGSIKKRRTCKNPDIDKALYKWFLQKRNQNVPINGPILQAQAEKFAAINGNTDFVCNHSWISRFIKRHDISFGKICGEANIVDFSKVDAWKTEMWDKIKDKYAEDDIFNVDEADDINAEIIDLLIPYFSYPSYSYEAAKTACGNVAGLIQWTISMVSFYSINRDVLPLKSCRVREKSPREKEESGTRNANRTAELRVRPNINHVNDNKRLVFMRQAARICEVAIPLKQTTLPATGLVDEIMRAVYGTVLSFVTSLRPTLPAGLDIGGGIVPFSEEIKTLGVFLSGKFNWDRQIAFMTSKVHHSLYALRFYKHALSRKMRLMLVGALVAPHLDYLAPLLTDLTKEQTLSLQRLQNACIRFIYGKIPRTAHVTHYRLALGWLSAGGRREVINCSLASRIIRDVSPGYLRRGFQIIEVPTETEEIRQSAKRRPPVFYYKAPHNTSLDHSFAFSSAIAIN